MAMQALGMRNFEEIWRYQDRERDGATLLWNGEARYDTAFVMGPQLMTRATAIRTRGARYGLVLSFYIDENQYLWANAQLPTAWASQKEYESAVTTIAEAMEELHSPNAEVCMMGDPPR